MAARRYFSNRSARENCWPPAATIRNCETKGTIYIPFRIHCPDCLGKNTVIDMTDIAKKTARVHTFMVCERSGAFNLLDKPIKFINIEFDGVATILMSYLSIGRS